MTKPVAISLFDLTGTMVADWARAGYECFCVDIQHSIRKERVVEMGEGLIRFVWGDVRTWAPPAGVISRAEILFAFPPCTHVAVSGARDFRTKGTGLLRDSLELFSAAEHAAKWSGLPYMIENPVGKFSDHMGRWDYKFEPWQFGDNYTKQTHLWTGGGFVMPLPKFTTPLEGCVSKMYKLPPREDRANLRSETPKGFARAVFEANSKITA